MLISVLMIYVL